MPPPLLQAIGSPKSFLNGKPSEQLQILKYVELMGEDITPKKLGLVSGFRLILAILVKVTIDLVRHSNLEVNVRP
jgi:hypothetical protein